MVNIVKNNLLMFLSLTLNEPRLEYYFNNAHISDIFFLMYIL